MSDSKEVKYTAPPKLLDLAALSARLAPKGIKANDVLAVYQKMYEQKIVSYPRTEDKTITVEQFNDLAPKVIQIAAVVGVDASLLTHTTPRKTHVKSGGAHGANRPGPVVPSSLDWIRQTFGEIGVMIYETLAKNYLAMLAEDYKYELEIGHLKNYPAFKGKVRIPLFAGWKAIFDDEKNDDEEENSSATGLGKIASPFIHEGFPKKPPTPTMKWLMGQLEKYDVGTGATRTSTYAEVTNDKNKYPLLTDTKGKIGMTQYGNMSYLLLPGTNIGNLKITEQVQEEMKAVSDGELDSAVGLAKVKDMVKEDIVTMLKNAEIMRVSLGIKQVTERERCEGVWNGVPVAFYRTYGSYRFTDEECQKLLNGETISVYGLKSKSGKNYNVTGRLEIQEYKGKKFVGFKSDGFAMPTSWCKHIFSVQEKDALERGEEVLVKGCLSSKGKLFSAYLKYDPQKGFVPRFE